MKNLVWKKFRSFFKAQAGFFDRISRAITDWFVWAEPRSLRLYERIDHVDMAYSYIVYILLIYNNSNRMGLFPDGLRRFKLSLAPVAIKGDVWTPLTAYYWRKAIRGCARK